MTLLMITCAHIVVDFFVTFFTFAINTKNFDSFQNFITPNENSFL